MITLRPFRALHYNREIVGDLSRVIAPPYDVIDAAHLERLYARSPLNVVRLILNREVDRYTAAANTLSAWWREGVLRRDSESCLYYYVQDFTLPDGTRRTRSGLMGAVGLQPFAEGNIRPHERTFPRAKEDRLRLIDACRTNLSPIFGVYPGRAECVEAVHAECARQPAWIDLVDETADRHRLWRLSSPALVESVVAAFREQTIFIADGHHRYETALAYRDQRRARGETDPQAPHNFILMYLASMHDPGLVILPTHRVVRALPTGTAANWLEALGEYFVSEAVPHTAEGERRVAASLASESSAPVLGLCAAGRDDLLLLRLRDPRVLDTVLADFHPTVRQLAVTVLDALVLRGVLGIDCTAAAQAGTLTYTHRDEEALAAVRGEGGAAAAFLVRPPNMREVEAVCLAGQTVPEKSTYFYPKLLSGLVFHSLDEPPRFAG